MWLRRHSAVLLGIVLVLGTVVSPVVHYTWMATSGYFGHADSHAMGMAHDHGAQVSTDDADHLTCDYDNLFATNTASTPPMAASLVAPALPGTVIPAVTNRIPSSPRNRAVCPRGPPAA